MAYYKLENKWLWDIDAGTFIPEEQISGIDPDLIADFMCEFGLDPVDHLAIVTRSTGRPSAWFNGVAYARYGAQKKLLSKRKSVEYGGFMLDGQRWDSEEKDELRLNSVSTMMEKMGVSEFPGWKINVDTFIVLTAQIAMRAAVAMMEHYNACFQVEEAKKAELHVLRSPEEVREWLAASLDAGWPAVEG